MGLGSYKSVTRSALSLNVPYCLFLPISATFPRIVYTIQWYGVKVHVKSVKESLKRGYVIRIREQRKCVPNEYNWTRTQKHTSQSMDKSNLI